MKKILTICLILAMKLNGMAQYKLDTIYYAGPSELFADIVFLGDGFTASEMDSFEFLVRQHASQYFEKTPLKEYKNMFNVFYVKTPSNESGAGMTPEEPIDNIFGTCFGTSGVDRMPWPTKWNKVYEVLKKTKPDYDMVPILVNKVKYGGGGSVPFICYSIDNSCVETLRHESGHALAGLADEYWYNGRERPNQTKDITNLKWKNWIGDEEIGTYRYSDNPDDEGYPWYRPHQNCLMRFLNRDFCAVCREAFIESIHKMSKNILGYDPITSTQKEIQDYPMTFKLNLLKPDPNTLRVKWMLDNKVIASNVDEITIESKDYKEGEYTLSASVEDTTLYVRTDDHSKLHTNVVKWDVKISVSSGIKVISDATAEFTIETLPFDTELVIRGAYQLKQPVVAVLTDMNGRKIVQGTFDDTNYCRLNTAQFPSGVYLLQILQNNQLLYSNKVLKR
jgi:hypothetical protein